MEACWDEDPDKRPVFADILERLRTMQPPPSVDSNISPIVPSALSPLALTEKFKHTTEVTLVHNWEIEAAELEFDREIGQGASAHVYLGKYRGQQVAIKVLKNSDGSGASILEEFKKELEIMRYIILLYYIILYILNVSIFYYLPYYCTFLHSSILCSKFYTLYPIFPCVFYCLILSSSVLCSIILYHISYI